MVEGLFLFIYKEADMAWIPFAVHWEESNMHSATAYGVSMADCNYAMQNVLQYFERIWEDIANSAKEWYGIKRYVTVTRDMAGRGIFICFTCERLTNKGVHTGVAVRVIAARPVHGRVPVLRVNLPTRFVPAPSLQEILGVGTRAT